MVISIGFYQIKLNQLFQSVLDSAIGPTIQQFCTTINARHCKKTPRSFFQYYAEGGGTVLDLERMASRMTSVLYGLMIHCEWKTYLYRHTSMSSMGKML